MSLMGSLGLDQVEADPNALPDGKWAGVIFKSEFVLVKSKGEVSLVITYKVTEGVKNGAQRQEWFTIGKNPLDANGNPTENINEVASMTPSMTEQQKPWFKKRLVDLGVAEADIPSLDPKTLVGKNVTFGTKKNNGYININFVELRDGTTATGPEAAPSGTPGAVSGLL